MKQNSGYLLLFIDMNFGIYMIRNILDDKKYVGSTGKLTVRWGQHRRALNSNVHFNPLLQNAWNKHGEASFVYEIIELCERSVLLDREEFWIAEKKSHKDEWGYNLCKKPRASRLGCKASPETIEKMKKSLSGKNHPLWGKKLTKRWISNMRRAIIGVPKPNAGKKKEFTLKSPDGNIINITGLRKFCRENNLVHSMLWRVATGKQEEYMGWKSTTKIQSKYRTPVVAQCGDKFYEFDSTMDAVRSNIFDKPIHSQNIVLSCQGKCKSCGKIDGKKVVWKYK